MHGAARGGKTQLVRCAEKTRGGIMRSRLWPVIVALMTGLPAALAAQERATSPLRLPSHAEARAVCDMVAMRGLAVRSMLVENGAIDANNDGVVDDASVAMREGTMRGEDLAFRPRGAPKASSPVHVTAKDFQPGDYLPFGARWLPYGDKIYTLYFEAEDLRYPTHLGYIAADNAERLVCDFDHSERETLRPLRDADSGLCRAVAQGDVRYLAPAEAQETDADVAARRWNSRVAGHVSLDYANTGVATPLTFESGGGARLHVRLFRSHRRRRACARRRRARPADDAAGRRAQRPGPAGLHLWPLRRLPAAGSSAAA
jgi:hypothetical protein